MSDEQISADDLVYLRKVMLARQQAQAIYEHWAMHLAEKYHLGQGDGVDEGTGVITRAAPEE